MHDLWRTAALASFVVAACSNEPTAALDGGPTASDAGTSGGDATPASPTADLDGAWHFELGGPADPSRFGCDVTLQFGGYEVLCASPDARLTVGPDCQRVRADRRITGSLLPPSFDGHIDVVEEYEGNGCAEVGYPSGIPIVIPDVGLMTASLVTPGIGEGFLRFLDGEWQWAYDDTYDGDDYLCDVTFAGGEVHVRCAGYPVLVGTACTAQTDFVAAATLTLEAMNGAVWTEVTREGAGCETLELPPFEQSDQTPIFAERR